MRNMRISMEFYGYLILCHILVSWFLWWVSLKHHRLRPLACKLPSRNFGRRCPCWRAVSNKLARTSLWQHATALWQSPSGIFSAFCSSFCRWSSILKWIGSFQAEVMSSQSRGILDLMAISGSQEVLAANMWHLTLSFLIFSSRDLVLSFCIAVPEVYAGFEDFEDWACPAKCFW